MKAAIKDEIEQIFKGCLTATVEYKKKHGIGAMAQYFPAVGCGAFLNGLDKQSKAFMVEAYAEALSKFSVKGKEHGISSYVCIYESENPVIGISSSLGYKTYKQKMQEAGITVMYGTNLFDLEKGNERVFNKEGYYINYKEEVIVKTNPWDSLAYIGNQQRADNSLDGFFVSNWVPFMEADVRTDIYEKANQDKIEWTSEADGGIRKRNIQVAPCTFYNSSFLHNAIFASENLFNQIFIVKENDEVLPLEKSWSSRDLLFLENYYREGTQMKKLMNSLFSSKMTESLADLNEEMFKQQSEKTKIAELKEVVVEEEEERFKPVA
jgi:hypothetical protein